MLKTYIHPNHPSKSFEFLGSNYYVFYKILYQIWIQEPVCLKDIEILTRCKVVGLKSIVKRKFGVQLLICNPELITDQLNKLRLVESSKRKEENTKFIMK